MKEKFQQVKSVLNKKGMFVECLANEKIEVIESSMFTFTEKQNQQYQYQGRGFDFTSSEEIENNGGIYVIITFIPDIYLQYNQFIGRTARVGNKGQYSIFLVDKYAQNCDAQTFLNKKLLELQNKDLLFVANLNKIQNSIINQKDLINLGKMEYFNDEKQINNILINEDQNILKDNPVDQIEFINTQNNCKNNGFLDVMSIENVQSLKQPQKNDIHNKNLSKKRIEKQENKEQIRQSKRISNKQNGSLLIDNAYFNSYSDPKIHEEMLNDQTRMKLYEEAINKTVQGKTVIDVDAGTGVLSLLAAKADAKKVYAIEQADIVKSAYEAIKDNNFTHIINVYKAKAEEVHLPIKHVDVIISEWMGYALIYENMLPTVLYVRDKYLKEGGILIPNRAMLYISAIYKQFNSNGLNLSSMNKNMIEQARVEIINKDQLITKVHHFYIDLYFTVIMENIFELEFALQALKDGVVNAFLLLFEVYLADEIILSTAPGLPDTHWKQTVLFFTKQFPFKGK